MKVSEHEKSTSYAGHWHKEGMQSCNSTWEKVRMSAALTATNACKAVTVSSAARKLSATAHQLC